MCFTVYPIKTGRHCCLFSLSLNVNNHDGLLYVPKDRAYELHKLGIEVHNEDLCNVDFLEELFLKYDFTHVAHMAAQAGVR